MNMPFLPSYNSSLFVNRDEDVQRIYWKISRFLKTIPVFPPHTAFHGPRGCGKSWLLLHLNESLPQKFGNQILLVFSPLDPADPYLIENTLRSACRALDFRLPTGVSLDEISRGLTEHCRWAGRPVVILVDELDKLTPEQIREIDLYYIAPLHRLPNVLFVLGSRVPAPGGYLNDVEFKRRVENRELAPFSLSDTEEQIRRLGGDPDIAPDILEAGGGYPISNTILARGWPTDPGLALEECAQALLEGIPEDLQQYFRALCVPDVIEIDHMPPLLATHFGENPKNWDTQRCRRILMDMVRTYLVRWRKWTSGYGYVMDPAVRQVLRSALQRNNPALWEKLLACIQQVHCGRLVAQ